MEQNSKHVIKSSLSEVFRQDYINYGLEVIVNRAIPAVEDGLKVVQRRIIYTLYEDGMAHTKQTKKSAKIVGDTMGKYHPHGDSSIYEAMVALGQPWQNRIPPVFIKGNIGNIQGLPAGAMRYTEARLSNFGDIFIDNFGKDVVQMKSNFDGDTVEPELLPVKIPYLLIAGSEGIAVGMRTSIPPHNPVEVLDAAIMYLTKKNVKVEDLLEVMPGPDFPTGGYVLNKSELPQIYKTGLGSIRVQGEIEKLSKSKLKVTKIPYTKTGREKAIYSEIDNAVLDKKIPFATKVGDYTNKNGIDIEISHKSGADQNKIIEAVFAKSSLQGTMSFDFLAIADGAPTRMSLLTYFYNYAQFQDTIIINHQKSLISKYNKRLSTVEALISILPNIETVIDLVRNADTVDDMRNVLMTGDVDKVEWQMKKHATTAKKFKFSEDQANDILGTPLKKLSKLDGDLLEKELTDLNKKIGDATAIVNSPVKRRHMIVKDLKDYRKQFVSLGLDKRLTKLVDKTKATVSDTVEEIDTYTVIDKYGYLHQLDSKADISEPVVELNTTTGDYLGMFTNEGQFCRIRLQEFPIVKPKDKGVSIAGQLGMSTEEHGLIGMFGSVMKLSDMTDKQSIIQITSDGFGKTVTADKFVSKRTKTVGTKLKTDDSELVYASKLESNTKYLVIVSEKRYYKRIKVSDINDYGKNTVGMTVSKPQDGDKIEFVFQVEKASDTIVVDGKEIKASDIPLGKLNHTMKLLQ